MERIKALFDAFLADEGHAVIRWHQRDGSLDATLVEADDVATMQQIEDSINREYIRQAVECQRGAQWLS